MAKDNGASHHLPLQRFPHLHLVSNTPKGVQYQQWSQNLLPHRTTPDNITGRGVFAAAPISAGTVIDTSPVLILGLKENVQHIEHTSLYHYTYNWPTKTTSGEAQMSQAVVFGLGSMFNHSSRDQNVGWKRDLDREVIVYQALRDISEGEELCISYGSRLTFVDADAPSDAVVEDAAEILRRIELKD